MNARDVHEALDALTAAGVDVWLDGGWGIDALVGEQTRAHSDLDAAVERRQLARAAEALAPLGFRHDDEAWPGLPARFVLVDAGGRQVDLHPLVLDAAGNGWQQLGERAWGLYPADDLAARGEVAGREVRCISAGLQLRFHLGWEWAETHERDLRVLARHTGIPLPPAEAVAT
jgi:lincosamide nucleotidyltransferase A/C/D/E